MLSERDRIKKKIQKINPNKWKSDNFDVRYYLISQLKKHEEKSVLDIGGGDGIILSELNQDTFRVNLDLALDDLKNCIKNVDSKINPICASITYLPFKKEIFDLVICSHVIELAKLMDYNEIKHEENTNKNVLTLVNETHRVLKNSGKLFLTTPNFAFRNSPNKLTFSELNNVLSKFFQDFKIYFYNTIPKIKSKSKFDFSNVVPKIWSKFSNPDHINSLLKEKSKNNYSVYFYAYARKN